MANEEGQQPNEQEQEQSQKQQQEQKIPEREREVPKIDPISLSWKDKKIQQAVGFWIALWGALVALVIIGTMALGSYLETLASHGFEVGVAFGIINGLLLSIGLGYVAYRWFQKSLVVVGNERPPRMLLMTRLGNVVGAAREGMFLAFYPIEKAIKPPTGQFTLNFTALEVYSKHDVDENEDGAGYAEQAMDLYVTFSFGYPHPDKQYMIPTQDAATWEDAEKEEKREWVWGSDLLAQAFRAVPFDIEDTEKNEYGPELAPAVLDAVGNMVVQFNHVQVVKKREEFERRVKLYLVYQRGSNIRAMGFPEALLDLAITRISKPQETQDAIRGIEIAYHKGQATIQTARAAEEAAPYEARAMEERAKGEAARIRAIAGEYLGMGASRDLALLLTSGSASGEGWSIDQLRDFYMVRGLGGFGGEQFGISEIMEGLKKMTSSDLNALQERIRELRRIWEESGSTSP